MFRLFLLTSFFFLGNLFPKFCFGQNNHISIQIEKNNTNNQTFILNIKNISDSIVYVLFDLSVNQNTIFNDSAKLLYDISHKMNERLFSLLYIENYYHFTTTCNGCRANAFAILPNTSTKGLFRINESIKKLEINFELRYVVVSNHCTEGFEEKAVNTDWLHNYKIYSITKKLE